MGYRWWRRLTSPRKVILPAAVLGLAACGSQEAQDRESRADYAAYTAQACEHAKSNVAMVENARSLTNTSAEDLNGREFFATVCREAARAAEAVARDTDQKRAVKAGAR